MELKGEYVPGHDIYTLYTGCVFLGLECTLYAFVSQCLTLNLKWSVMLTKIKWVNSLAWYLDQSLSSLSRQLVLTNRINSDSSVEIFYCKNLLCTRDFLSHKALNIWLALCGFLWRYAILLSVPHSLTSVGSLLFLSLLNLSMDSVWLIVMSLESLNMAGGVLGTAFSLLLLASITQGNPKPLALV